MPRDTVTAAGDQATWVRDLISQEPAADGDKPAVTGWLQRMCRAAVRELSATGVGISVLSRGSDPMTIAASSEASVLVEELQFTLGEGPCIDAFASRSPVLVPDLSATATTTWPGYAPAAHDHGVRAVFAFPLQVGIARLGALDIYRDHTGSLSSEILSRALTFAEVAMQALLDARSGPDEVADLMDDSDGNFLEVFQAQGMVLAQLGVSAEEALSRLRAYAYAHDRRLIDVARDVTARRLRLESDA
jgi:hypothetical protein